MCRPGSPKDMERPSKNSEISSLKDAPTRLLHIQDESGELHVRVVDTCYLNKEDSEHLIQSGYLTLSYCWGKDQPLKLTTASEPSLRNGIPSSILPKTLRDAIFISHSLERQFLWIDALCIMQDSNSDKALEIANMARYYSKSTLAICAASAAHCDGGLFQAQSSARFDFGPIRLAFKSKAGDLGYVYLTGNVVQKQDPEPLTTRAWTFQETMLSQRMLIFGRDEVHWSCKSEHGSAFGGVIPRITSGADTLIEGIDSLDPLRYLLPEAQWKLMTRNYSKRLLGFSADKLPAISALASVLQDGTSSFYDYSCYAPMVYVAGLYILPNDRQSWVNALLWATEAMPSTTRPQPYRAPSWSWASVDGRILESHAKKSDLANDFYVEDYNVILDDNSAPFGMVKDASLDIRARCRILDGPLSTEIVFALENDDKIKEVAYKPYVLDHTSEFLKIYPDALGYTGIIEEALSGKDAVLLVEMMKMPPAGLILCPSTRHSQQPSPTYERIGCFFSHDTSSSLEFKGSNIEDLEDVFGAAQVLSLRVV